MICLTFTLIFLSGYSCAHLFGQGLTISQNNDIQVESEIVQVQIFYECLCPGCRYFDTKILAPAVRKISKNLDVQIYPYGNANTTEENGHFVIECQHGPEECYGNKLHACAIDIFKNNTESVLFNACTMEKERPGNGSNDEAVQYCGEQMGHDPKPIIKCAGSERGEALLKKAGDDTHRVVPNMHMVPCALINGKQSDLEHFWSLVCKEFKNTPDACKQ